MHNQRACRARCSSSFSRSSSISSASASSFRCCRSTRRPSAPLQLVIGLLFASFSLAQLIATPVLGVLSDRLGPTAGADLQPARHSRELRHARHGAEPDHAVRRANHRWPVGRQHHHRARVHRGCHRAARAREGLRLARRGVRARVHRRAGPGGRVFAYQLHGAHLGGGGRHADRDGHGVVLAAGDRASRKRRHRVAPGERYRTCSAGRSFVRCSWPTSCTGRRSRVCNTTFALFASRRFGFDVAHTGYVLAGFGLLGVIVQVGMVGVGRTQDRRDCGRSSSGW